MHTSITLLQIRSTTPRQGFPSPAILSLNHPIRGIMLILNRLTINTNKAADNYETLVE